MSQDTQDEQWKAFLEGSMFEDHFDELGKICDEAYGGNSELFDNEFLRPMCLLLQELKTGAEKYFISIGKNDEVIWLPCYERFVTSVIHLSRLSVTLHKGDFYFHLNFGSPGEIILKHYNSGDVVSRPLAKHEYEDIWSQKWTERLSQTFNQRFLFMNCLVNNHNGRALERRPWRYLMSIDSAKGKDMNNKDINEDELSLQNSASSTLSLFCDLEKNAMSALDVNFEVLHSKVICMPGARDKRGAPVIFVDSAMPEWELQDFNSEEIARVCLYFYQIPREDVMKLGFTFLIDARNSDDKKGTLQIIGEALIFFEEMRSNSVHIAYILGRKDSYLMMFSANKLKEQLKFQFKLLSSINELVTFIDLNQLLINFGGDFEYDHDEWLQFRLKQEPFMAGCRSAIKLALTAMENLHMGDSYTNVEECEIRLEEHQSRTTAVFSDSRLSALQIEGEQLVANLKQNNDMKNNSPDWNDTMETVSKLYFKMNQVFSKLDVLCRKRKRELEDCLQLCCFHEEFSKTLAWIENDGSSYVETPIEFAESYSHAITNHNELETFLKVATTYIIQAYDLLEEGSDIAQSGCEQSIGIKEMCKVLKVKLDAFTGKLENRRISLVSCVEFHQLLRQCSNWSIHALKFMALMNMEASNTAQGVASLKSNIEGFLQEFPMWNKDKLNEISELTKIMNNEELQNQSEKCLSEYKEVEDMFSRRQDTLQRAAVRVQVPGTCTNGVSEGSSSTSTSNSTSGIQEDVAELESDEEEGDKSDLSDSDSSLTSPIRRNEETEEPQHLFYSLKTTEEMDAETYEELSPRVKEKLTYIVSEMVETERDYVKSLEYIIQNYVKEMDSDDLPASLRGRKNLLFGNIERLYDFHHGHFSQELERHIEQPFQIGGCFLKWERQFFLYALYNKNKPVSDELLRDHGSVYFRKRQEQLNDKLDLCSYLIKPVQRIGKYALLLRDMIKAIETDSSCTSELRNAQEMVKSQLRHGNDLLAMDSIRDCDVNVKEQGRLLRQDDFMVWQSKKKHFRRVFLFEDIVLFSKTRKQASGADIFIYKSCLKTADIGLTETVGESGLRFELWFRRRRNVRKTVILQAKDMATKTAWVIEITRLLWRQAVRTREYGLAEATTGISVGSQPGEQVPTTRSPAYDESFQFSATTSMSVMPSRHSYAGGVYTSPLLNNRRYNRRLTTLKRNQSAKQQTLSPDSKDLSTAPAEEQLSTPASGDVTRFVKSQSCPAELKEESQEEGRFERRPSLKQRLFGGRGRSKNNENEHVTHSNENLSSKNNKSKKKTLKERFSSSRPMSVAEIPSTHHQHDDSESPHIHRSHSDASMVTRKQPTTTNTSTQEPIAEQPNACYHSVV